MRSQDILRCTASSQAASHRNSPVYRPDFSANQAANMNRMFTRISVRPISKTVVVLLLRLILLPFFPSVCHARTRRAMFHLGFPSTFPAPFNSRLFDMTFLPRSTCIWHDVCPLQGTSSAYGPPHTCPTIQESFQVSYLKNTRVCLFSV